MGKRAKIASLFSFVVVLTVLFFQNCSPIGFTQQELKEIIVSSESTNAQDVVVIPAEVCSAANSLQFEAIYKDNLNYKCYDLTSQKYPTGPICTEGPTLLPIFSTADPVDCSLIKVCGIQPADVVKTPGPDAGTTKVSYKFNNLPIGCAGKIRIEEHFVNEANQPAINVIKEIALALPKGTCKTCSDGNLTCGNCPQPQTLVCTPNSSSSCPITNGIGSKTCNSDGSAWGACNLVSCNSGFVPSGNTCVPVSSPGVSLVFSKTLNGASSNSFAVGDVLYGKVSGVSAANAFSCIEYSGGSSNCSDVNTYTKMPNSDWAFDGTYWRAAIPIGVEWGGKTYTGYWYDSVSKKSATASFSIAAAPVVLTLSRTYNGASATSFNVGETVYFKVSGVTANNAYSCIDWIGSSSMCTDISKFTKMPNADWSFDGTFWRATVVIDAGWGGKTFTGYWRDTFTGGAGQRTFTVAAQTTTNPPTNPPVTSKVCEIVVKPNPMTSWPGTKTDLVAPAFQVNAKLSPANSANSFLYGVSFSYNESTIRVSFCTPGMTAAEMSSATTTAGGLWGNWSATNATGYGLSTWGSALCAYMGGGNFTATGSFVNSDGTHRINCAGAIPSDGG